VVTGKSIDLPDLFRSIVRPCVLAGALGVVGTFSTLSTAGTVEPRTVYGQDNRTEVFTLSGTRANNANATVALVDTATIRNNGDGTSRLVSPTLGAAFALCPGQRFRSQPTAAFCSGVLARSNIVVTAGHCVDSASLSRTRFIFGYRMIDNQHARTTIANSEIYRGAQLLADRVTSGVDYAVVRLDRNVTGHTPAQLATGSSIALNTPLYVIGHPSGLPAKFAAGARVERNNNTAFFTANLDTFGGNSGSPVFNANTNRVAGILVRGAEDYRFQGNCEVANVLPDANGQEESTRMNRIIPSIPASIAPALVASAGWQ